MSTLTGKAKDEGEMLDTHKVELITGELLSLSS